LPRRLGDSQWQFNRVRRSSRYESVKQFRHYDPDSSGEEISRFGQENISLKKERGFSGIHS